MNHILIVDVLDRIEQLRHEKCCFRLGKTFPTFDHLVQALVVAQLEKDVAVLTVLEEMLVFTHVAMFESTVDLDLRLQL